MTVTSDNLASVSATDLFGCMLDEVDRAICLLNQETELVACNKEWQRYIESNCDVPLLAEAGCNFSDMLIELKGGKWQLILASALRQQRGENPEYMSWAFSTQHGESKKNYRAAIKQIAIGENLFIYLSLADITEEIEIEHRIAEMARVSEANEMATGVLHNVGNVLNSVSISAGIVEHRLENSPVASLNRLTDIISQNMENFSDFVTNDQRGKVLPQYICRLNKTLIENRSELIEEVHNLVKNVDHIKEIVNVQQSYAKLSGTSQEINMIQIMEDALTAVSGSLVNHKIDLIKNFEAIPSIESDKHKILQILVNLITNAKDALSGHTINDPCVVIDIYEESACVVVDVTDNGSGIRNEHLGKIFQHGFTTKKTGHGFGLHSCMNAATEMGGSLAAQSDGPGTGATFRLKLPIKRTPIGGG